MSERRKPPGWRDILHMATRDAATRAANMRPTSLRAPAPGDEDAAFKRGAQWAFDVLAQEFGEISDGTFACERDRRKAFMRWMRHHGWK